MLLGNDLLFTWRPCLPLPLHLQARKAVEARSQITQKLAHKQREEKEEQMRLLAQKAREQRAGIRSEAVGAWEGECAVWWGEGSVVWGGEGCCGVGWGRGKVLCGGGRGRVLCGGGG